MATQTTNVTTILTLCNYDYYNPISQAEEQPEEQSEGRRTAGIIIKKEDKKENIKENLIKENSFDPEKLKEEGYVFYKDKWVLLGELTYQQQQEIILGDPIDPNDPNPYSPLDPKTQAFYDRLDERERKEAEEEAEIKKMQDAMR